jgi:hypothetical protein
VIDEEVATLLREAEQRVTVTLTNHRHALDRLTELLLEREPIDGAAVTDILGLIPDNRGEPAGATAARLLFAGRRAATPDADQRSYRRPRRAAGIRDTEVPQPGTASV